MGEDQANLRKEIKAMEQEMSKLRTDLDILERENEILKIEKSKNQNIIKELTNWVNDLTYSLLGKESEIPEKIAKGLEQFKEMERKVAEIKRELLLEKKKFIDLAQENRTLRDEMNKYKRDMMSSSEGLLLIEKSNLQETLKRLSEEVEYLSSKNEQLILDLRQRNFFDAYQNSLTELEKIREEYFKLLKVTEFESQNQTEVEKPSSNKTAVQRNSFSIKTIFNCNKGVPASANGKKV